MQFIKLIEWQDSYSVGISLIDGQHKKLFDWINEFYTAINKKGYVKCFHNHGLQ